MGTVVEAALPIIGVLVIMAFAAALLTRQRNRVRPTDLPPEKEVLQKASKRQRKVLEKLEPLPEIPSVMDLMRQEIEETGVENIPGHEGLQGPVMLKVFRRDHLVRERCTHDAYEFVVGEGIEPEAATEDQVVLFCSQCGEPEITEQAETREELGTDTET